MILIDNSVNLDQLSENHFQELINPKNKDGSYHATQSLIGRIEKQLKADLLFPNLLFTNRVKFWNYFLNNNFLNLKKVISGTPQELASAISDIESLIGSGFLSNSIGYNRAYLTPFGNIVKVVFGYENYRDNGLARFYVEQFGISYCPYCNIHKLESIKRDGLDISALYQLDHFYPRARHPYLAVSFYNLIPACSSCNTNLKQEKNFNVNTHINPFDKSFDDFFSFKLTKVVFNNVDDVEIEIENIKPHNRASIIDFELINRYNDSNTKMKVFDLLEVLKTRSKKLKKSYSQQIRGLFSSPNISDEVLLKSLQVPVLKDNINDYEMGKMKRDICKQLKIVNI